MGANVPAVTAKRGRHRWCTDANPQQAQFHAPTQRREDESASDTGPCIPVQPTHVRAME
jgi:hypothetical protein